MSLWRENIGTTLLSSMGVSPRTESCKLEDDLNEALKKAGASEYGVCSLREEAFDDIFKKLCLKVGADEPARGDLLTRVMYESKMKKDIFKALLRSSVEFGKQKASEHDDYTLKCSEIVSVLEKDISVLRKEVYDLNSFFEVLHRRTTEDDLERENRFRAECDLAQAENEQLHRLNEMIRVKFGIQSEEEKARAAAAQKEREAREAERQRRASLSLQGGAESEEEDGAPAEKEKEEAPGDDGDRAQEDVE